MEKEIKSEGKCLFCGKTFAKACINGGNIDIERDGVFVLKK